MSQKFVPELDQLVDMTKVNLDVVKPWIANRVAQLLRHEDEIVINFIYSQLEGKEVDGNKVQTQLTGFMEKNTVKFMEELWSLLLSAQHNASGVPQQFLDAKEAEHQQRKAEEVRKSREIQRREKDGRDSELENLKKMGGDAFDHIGSTSVTVEEKELDLAHSSGTKNWQLEKHGAAEEDKSPPETTDYLKSRDEEEFQNMMLNWKQLYKDRIACIESSEKMHKVDIGLIREAYNAFLKEFPFSFGHWIKYTDHEKCSSKSNMVLEVYERAVTAVPDSVDIWHSYCQFAVSTYEAQQIIRSLFERALRFVGKKYNSARLWDLYLEYEDSRHAWHHMAAIYTRILGNPIEDLDWYFSCFKHFVLSHALDEILTREEVCLFDSFSLAYEKSKGAPLTEVDKLQLYISIWQEAYENTKENVPSVVEKERTTKPSLLFQQPCQPCSGFKSAVPLLLREFLRLNLHTEEVKFPTDNSTSILVMTPLGTRMLKAIFSTVTRQYEDGLCWAGELQQEDILVHFDGSVESDVYVVFLKHATIPVSTTNIISDCESFEKMLWTPFSLNGNAVPYLVSLFGEIRSPPTDMAANSQSRHAWLEMIRSNPTFSSLSSRLRLYRHLHKLYKNGSEKDQEVFDSEFAGVKIPNNFPVTVSQDRLLAEVYWYTKEKKNKNVTRTSEEVMLDVSFYKLSDIITLINQMESHGMEILKALKISTDNFSEIEHMIDLHFGFLLPPLVRCLHKIAPSNPKFVSILQSFIIGN